MGKSSWCKKLILFPLNFGRTSSGNCINLANHYHNLMIHHRFLEARDVMTSFCIFRGSTLVNQILLAANWQNWGDSLFCTREQAHTLHGWNWQSLEKRVEVVFAIWRPCLTSQSLSRQNATFLQYLLQCFCIVLLLFSNVLQLCLSLFFNVFAVDLKCFCHVEEKVAGQSLPRQNTTYLQCIAIICIFFAFFVLFFQCEGGAWLVSQCPVKMRHWQVPVLASCTLCLHFVVRGSRACMLHCMLLLRVQAG